MSHEARPSAPPPQKAPLAAVGILLAIAIVAPLLVGTYDRTDPKLGSVPFYFWWQFLLIFVSVIATSISYVLVKRYDRQRHDYERALDARDGRPLDGGDGRA